MERRRFSVILTVMAIAIALITHLGHGSRGAIAQEPPCFYQKSDGTVVDLRGICGKQAPPMPNQVIQRPSAPVMPQSTTANPAMQITSPNDPGVLYLSGSGGDNPAAQAASRAEQAGGR